MREITGGDFPEKSDDQELVDFAELIQRARNHDRGAMEELCQHYEAKLRVVARVLLGPAMRPHLDSVDLVQSVHHTLMVGLTNQKYDISSPEKLVALALAIVRRKVARHWRTMRRQQRLSTGAAGLDPLPQLLMNLTSHEIDPSIAAQHREQIALFCQKLSAVERQVLQMRADGYSPGEIAAALHLHPTTLRVRMTRLRERLRSHHVVGDWL